MNCEELCKKAGFDITSIDFWKSGIEFYSSRISEFIELCKGKSTAVTVKAGSSPKTVYESIPAEKTETPAKTEKPAKKMGLLQRAEILNKKN